MSAVPQDNQAQKQEAPKPDDKELNFNKLRQGYEKALEQERQDKLRMQQEIADLRKAQERFKPIEEEDDNDDEPYVDKKKLEKRLNKFESKIADNFDKRVENKAKQMLEEYKQQTWLKNNPDFHEVMQYAEKFAEKDPELADTILEMPPGFERQKLVYRNIKAMGIHKKEEPKPSIQETIDKNKRSPYYQPTGVGSAPYGIHMTDDSPTAQKNAYEKMKQLQSKLRLG